MKRRDNWEQRLHEYLAGVRDKPHKYGHHDCLLFPAGAVKAVTGHDFGRGHRRKYDSAISAGRYLSSLGFNSPAEMVDSLLEGKPTGFAQRGDVVLVPANEEGGWDIPAICVGSEALAVGANGTQEGLVRIPRRQWLKAWAVG